MRGRRPRLGHALAWATLLGGARATPGGGSADALIILQPNSEDTWMKGGSYSVLWTSMRDDIALCSSVEIALMRGTRRVDTVTTENDGAHLFYVRSAVEDSDDYRLHLQCVQPRSLSAALQGTSDRFVVESNPATFDVSSPAKGAVWPLASDNVVSWSLARSVRGSTACDRVQLLLIRRAEASSSHPDEPISLVTVTPAETGTDYAFHVPARTPPGTYLMRVQCAGDTALGGESEPFRISLNPGALVVTQPRQGQRCLLGHECPLAWTSTLIGHTSTCAQLEGALLDDGRTVGEFRAPIGAKALGRYLPASLAPGSRYTYELRCANDSAVRAASKYFKVEADAEALELSSPQPGEFWSSGLAHEVRWESSVSASPNCSTVSIDLVAGPAPSAASRPPSRSRGRGGRGSERAPPRQPTRVLASWPHAPNSGSHEVYVPGSTPAGEGYEIRLVCDGDQALRVSSAPFTIQPDSGALSFTSPSEGAEWTAGSVQFVQWEASDGLRSAASCAHVDVLVRHDGHTLSSARAPNDGRYSLYINGSLASGPGYQLVLRCAADSGVSAQSPYFSVAALPRAFALTTPSAASEWVPGQSYAVRWSSPLQLSDVCDTVRAELLAGPTASARRGRRQRDAARDSLVAAVEASNTGRAWLTLPRSLDAGDEYRVRLSCVRDPALNSTSAAFSVRAPCAGAGCHDDDTRRAAVGAAPSPSRGALGGAPSAPTQPVTPWGSVRTTPGVSPLPFSSRTDARAPPPPPPGSLTRGGSGGSGSSSRLSGGLPLVGMEEEADAAEGGGVRSADDPDGLCDAGGHVAAGMSHSCAVTSTGGLLCWGDNTEGQTEVPAEVDGWLQVSAGVTHTCAVTAERTLRCWGGRHRWTPVAHHEAAVPSGELWHHVSAGHAFSCAVSLSHRLACWGYDGEMGGDRPPRGLLWTSVSVGEAHACGITTEGAAVCWGDNSNGQSNVPFRARWAQVSTHHRHTCGVTADAELVCWGSAEHGQLDAPEGYEWSAVSVGHSHSCGLTKERLLRCWGHLTFGLGNAPPGYRWAEISVGMYHACGLVESDGDVLCWGMDYHSQAQVPQGYKYWVGCDGPAPLGARGVESEHKPGKFVCPQHETLHAGTAYESRDAVERKCGELDCASYVWARSGGAEAGRVWFCKHDYYDGTTNGAQWADWEVGRPVTACAPSEGDVKLSAYPAGELLMFSGGQWGTVCQAGFAGDKLPAASVACRQLGYSHAIRTYPYRGAAHTPQALAGVHCHGAESRLADCEPSPYAATQCSHEFGDVGVHCAGNEHPSPCGSAPAAHIRDGAGEAKALLLHGAVATTREAPHSFDGQLRYTSGGYVSHGRLRSDAPPRSAARAAAHSPTTQPTAGRGLQLATAGGCGVIAMVLAAAMRSRHRARLEITRRDGGRPGAPATTRRVVGSLPSEMSARALL